LTVGVGKMDVAETNINFFIVE